MSIASSREGGTSGSSLRLARLALLTGVLAAAGCSRSSEQPTSSWQPTRVERDNTLPTVPGQPPAGPKTYTGAGSVPMTAGVYKVGKPYTISGVTYVPQEDPSYDRVGQASWYGTDFHARQTANGEYFDMHRITAAHPTLPLPSLVYVTNIRNGRTVLARVNDRGPYKPGRIIDLSRQTARLLGFEAQGTTEIRVRYAGPAPLDPSDDRRERQHLAGQSWNQTARAGSGGGSGWGRWFGLGMGGAMR